jgi:hypothetical protein
VFSIAEAGDRAFSPRQIVRRLVHSFSAINMSLLPRQRDLLPVITLGLAWAVFVGCGDAPATREVPEEVQGVTQVAYVVLLFRKEHGRLPESMDEIVAFDDSTPVADDWGNDFTYAREGNEFTVSSAGPDKQAGTPDDLRAVLRAPVSD